MRMRLHVNVINLLLIIVIHLLYVREGLAGAKPS